MSDPEAAARRIASQAGDEDPTGWFDKLYAAARTGDATIPWDRGGPHPLLQEWTSEHALDGHGRSAITVGCGLGAEEEHLAALGFDTTAFDISPTAVATARERHPESRVDYATADLLALPAMWQGAFDFVFESLTVQSLPTSLREQAIRRVSSLVAPGGTLLVISGQRPEGTNVIGPPWPLTETEIKEFSAGGLHTFQIELIPDQQDSAVRRWRAEFRRDV